MTRLPKFLNSRASALPRAERAPGGAGAPRRRSARRLSQLVAILSLGLGGAGCEKAPEEPTPQRSRATPTSGPTLHWKVPPTWNVERTADQGEYRAKYTLPATGNAQHPAELLVSRVGSQDVGQKLEQLVAEFEGPQAAKPTRTEMKVGDFDVTLVDVAGTYKFPMGPAVGPKQRHAAHVLKDGWRALAAGVVTKDRGNWLFRMVGPNDAVEGSRSAFVSMLEALE